MDTVAVLVAQQTYQYQVVSSELSIGKPTIIIRVKIIVDMDSSIFSFLKFMSKIVTIS